MATSGSSEVDVRRRDDDDDNDRGDKENDDLKEGGKRVVDEGDNVRTPKKARRCPAGRVRPSGAGSSDRTGGSDRAP